MEIAAIGLKEAHLPESPTSTVAAQYLLICLEITLLDEVLKAEETLLPFLVAHRWATHWCYPRACPHAGRLAGSTSMGVSCPPMSEPH